MEHNVRDTQALWDTGNVVFMRAITQPLRSDIDPRVAIAVAPLPIGPTGHGAATLYGGQLGISNYSANPAAAAAVVGYLTGLESQRQNAIDAKINPTILELYDDPGVLAAPSVMNVMPDILAAGVVRPSTVASPNYNQVSERYSESIASILSGEEDPVIALELLQLDLADFLTQ
ncbi:hypothetical protein ACFLYO_05165 [Chloroflexota bacterium]